ncbi:MAG: hypothetical protein J6X00_03780 [Clostridia bacterium]|nr:hypothetical protein [Clostridia bacterium]
MKEEDLLFKQTVDGFASEKINTIANRMFGTIDKNGHYDISQPIKDELVKLPKFKKTTFNNSVFCVVNKPGIGELVFKIDYEKNTKDNVAKATMYLLENLYKVNGYLQDTIKTKIAEYVSGLDGFIENSYKEFNVSVKWETGADDDEGGMEYVPQSKYLLAQKAFLDALNKLTSDKYNAIYEDYFTEKLKVINGLGSDFSKAVLEDFRSEYAKIEKFFLSNKDYKALSELLDVCVERNRLLKAPIGPQEQARYEQEKEYFAEIEKATAVFTKKAEDIRENAVEKAKNRLDEAQKESVEELSKVVVKPVAEAKPEPKPEVKKEEPAPAKKEPAKPAASSTSTTEQPEKNADAKSAEKPIRGTSVIDRLRELTNKQSNFGEKLQESKETKSKVKVVQPNQEKESINEESILLDDINNVGKELQNAKKEASDELIAGGK